MNRASYNAIAAEWDAARTVFFGRERDYLNVLLAGLAGSGCVLDLGCGTGRPIAESVLRRGHQIVGVDQAESLLELARKRFPDGTWLHGEIETFVPERRFHAIVCWDTLFHIDRAAHETLFERFARWLLPGARLMLTVGGSAHPAFVDTMFGQPFFYDSHPPGAVLEMLGRQGFAPLVSELMNPPTSGRDKGRYAIVASRT